jgi:hypothetical protein
MRGKEGDVKLERTDQTKHTQGRSPRTSPESPSSIQNDIARFVGRAFHLTAYLRA